MTGSDILRPGLLVLHGNRLELLRDAVFDWLERAPLAPLEEEVFLVQSNGTAEWVKAQWALRRGICAAVRTELPARFVWRSYRAVLGAAGAPAQSPLDKAPLRWRLLAQLPGLLGEPGFEPLAHYLSGGGMERRLQLATVLADLFDQYQVYRADWLRAWGAGVESLVDGRGVATPLPAEHRWQARLWRALVDAVPEGGAQAARPEVHQRFLAALGEGGAPPVQPLPRRVVVFGMSQLPLQTLQALMAMAGRVQVLIAVPNPCQFHWADVIDGREWFANTVRRQRLRGGTDLAALPLHEAAPQAHPLLAAWGRQGRDFMRLLDEHEAQINRLELFDPAAPQTLLQQVQAAVRDGQPLAEHPRSLGEPAPAQADRSIVFHLAHSAQREVEVLHGQLLHLLAHPGGGESLAPRQIVVMVPDLQPFEAAIRAVFDQVPPGDPRHIPYSIADLGPRGREPLLLALDWLLRAPEPRCTASELRELLAVPALARRLGLAEDDLPRLEAWWAGSGLRWGLDAAHRARLGLPEAGEGNTWRFAVDRLLLGYASGEGPAFDGIEPYPEVGGLEAALAGSLALLFERLQAWWHDALLPRRPAAWAERLRALLADLFAAVDEHDRGVLAALETALLRWLDDCARADFEAEVPLAVARAGWLDALEEPSLSQRFTGGGVTFCTLMPMRAIPFEVVCLLGMNEGDYPRRRPRQDFDLLQQPGQRRPGDRAGRDDDRYLMLEALLAARRLLYVSWTGRSVRDNTAQPPSVLVGELRDYLDAGFGDRLAERLTTEHPLQPFSRRYFEPGAAERGWITYMREWREAHEAPLEPAPAAPALAFDPSPLMPLTAARLAAFLKQPVRQHFRERLDIRFDAMDAALDDEEPFGLDGLQVSRLVTHLLEGAQRAAVGALGPSAGAASSVSVEAASAALRPGHHPIAADAAPTRPGLPSDDALVRAAQRLQGEGVLPLGPAGDWTRARLQALAAPMLAAWQAWWQAAPDESPPLPLRFELGALRVDDWLGNVRLGPSGPVHGLLQARRLLEHNGEALRPPALIDAWVLALLAGATGLPLSGRLIGLDAQVHWTAPPVEQARDHLAALLEGWQAGLQQPLPVACRTALAWLAKDDLEAAAAVYEGGNGGPGEGDDPCLARTWPSFDALVETDAFEAWAEQLYAPLRQWAQTLVWSPLGEGHR